MKPRIVIAAALLLLGVGIARAEGPSCAGRADGTPCLATCIAQGQCMNQKCKAIVPSPDGTGCASGNLCSIGDRCVGGMCTPGTDVVDCPEKPGSMCLVGACNPSVGCIYTNICDFGGLDPDIDMYPELYDFAPPPPEDMSVDTDMMSGDKDMNGGDKDMNGGDKDMTGGNKDMTGANKDMTGTGSGDGGEDDPDGGKKRDGGIRGDGDVDSGAWVPGPGVDPGQADDPGASKAIYTKVRGGRLFSCSAAVGAAASGGGMLLLLLGLLVGLQTLRRRRP